MAKDYNESPVDVWTFLTDNRFLGKSTNNGKAIFPVWKDALTEIFDDMSKTTIVLTGSVRTGKSTIALYGLAYVLYRLLILKNPWDYFGLTSSSRMAIIFFNLNKTLGGSRGFSKLQASLIKSTWFRSKASYTSQTKYGDTLVFPNVEFLLASPYSKGYGIVGSDVVSGILDEVDTEDESLTQKRRVLNVYNAAEIRFKTSFASEGNSLGKLFVVSSKMDEMSFMDAFIAERKKFPEVAIYDVPLWKAQPAMKYSGKTFPVAVGDSFNPPQILNDGQQAAYVAKGYSIIDVPVEFKSNFASDLIRALREIAGVTVAGVRKSKLFASRQDILTCLDNTKQNPVKVEVIETGLNDPSEYIKYFDLSRIRLPKDKHRFFHYDIAFSGEGDACALSMAGVKEWRSVDIQNEDGTYRKDMVPIVETDFSVRIKARPGDRIPFHKIRKLVLDIRAAGYFIELFTADLKNMSEDTQQLLTAAGITTDDLSLDRTLQPYFSFRDVVQEGRWVCHHLPLLITELDNLEHDKIEGKIDHPDRFIDRDASGEEKVLKGSKDLADATAGAVHNALKSKKPMNFDLISKMMDRTSTKAQDTTENISRLTETKKGETIVGTKQGDTVDKINDIFKRMHNRG